MRTTRRGHSLMRSVVEVDFAGGFYPRTFYHRYRDRIFFDSAFAALIESEQVLSGSGRGHLGYQPLESEAVPRILPLARLWQASCLFERQLRGITDPQHNPLRLARGISLFPIKFVQQEPAILDRPPQSEHARLVMVTTADDCLRIRTLALQTTTIWPTQTYLFTGI